MYTKKDLKEAYEAGSCSSQNLKSFDDWIRDNDPIAVRKASAEKYFREHAKPCILCEKLDILVEGLCDSCSPDC